MMDYTTEGQVYTRLAIARSEKGLERDELADTLGITPQKLGYIELGKLVPSLELALRLSEYLEVPMQMLFARQPFPDGRKERVGRWI